MKMYKRLSIERRTIASPIRLKLEGLAAAGATAGAALGGVGAPIGAGIGALLDVGMNLFSSSQNWKHQRELQEREFAFTREMADWQWNKSLEMFDKENAYNTPEAQMQRFLAAGINPYVAFSKSAGNAVAANGAAPSLPSTPSAPQPTPFTMGNLSTSFGAMAQAIESFSKSKKTDTETERMKKMFTYELESMELNNAAQRIAVEIAEECKQYDIDIKKESVQKIIADIGEIRARGELQMATKELTEQNIKNAIQQLENLKSEQAKTDAEKELIDKQIKWFDAEARSRIEVNKATAYNQREQGKTQSSVRALNDAQRKQVETFTKHQDILNKYAGAKQMRELRTMSSSAKLQVVDRLLSYGVIEFTANGEVKLSASAEGGLRLPASVITANSKLAGELGVKAGAKGSVYLNQKQVQKLVDSAIEDVWYSDDYDD